MSTLQIEKTETETPPRVLAPAETEAPPVAAPSAPAPQKAFHGARWQVRALAIFAALMGLLNLWSAVTPGLPPRIKILLDVLPFEARRGSHLTAALAGFALLLLSFGLWRRKQVAWALTLGALFVSIIAHLLKGFDYEEALCALALAAWLWNARFQFHARSDAPSVKQGLRVLAGALLFTLAYGTLGFYLLDAHFRTHFGWLAALQQTATMFTQLYDPGLQPTTRFGHFFADSIYLVAACTFGYAALMLARPVLLRQTATPEERRRAREIVEAHGDTAFAFCALFDDKRYWFSAGGSVVPYALVGRVAVSMGDPIGPSADKAAAIHGFIESCARNDWRPAFYEIYDEHLAEHRAAGLRVLRIAHEAILDLKSWTLAGKSGKDLRNVVNALKKAGHSARFHPAPLSDALLEELREVSDAWLAMMRGGEKQFSLGAFEDDYVRSSPVMAIHDENGNITAFANLVSCYNLNESTIDLMRRRPEVFKGTMDFLFVSMFEWAKESGFDTFNIGPSPFAMVGEHSSDPATEKAIHFLYEHVNTFYNFKGLHAFKEKFHPQWRALYLSYGGAGGLMPVATAVIRADSGQSSWLDFLRHLRGEKGDA